MGILTGYISLACLLFLAAKFVTRKTKNQKLDRFFHRLHKPVSGIFLLTGIVHLFLVLPVWNTRSMPVNFSGVAALAILLLLIVACHGIKDAKKRMFWHRLLTIVLLILAACHVTAYYIDFAQYQNHIKSIRIDGVDISGIPDGKYIGDYDAGYIYARVQVTVSGGKIADVEILEHQNERGEKAESITGRMVGEQKIDVDVVSGATNSSLVIKKACENALREK